MIGLCQYSNNGLIEMKMNFDINSNDNSLLPHNVITDV